jgi:hypothetical protein
MPVKRECRSEIVATGGGLLFVPDHGTIAGKLVLTLLPSSPSSVITQYHEIARDWFARKTERAFRCFPARSTTAASI